MKFILAFCILTLFLSCTHTSKTDSKAIEQLREKKIAEFLDPSTSPLDAEELKTFSGISFFPVDDSYKVKATLSKIAGAPLIDMPHTLNRTYQYQTFGTINFTLKGKKFALPVYTNDELKKDSSLFFSFTDLTNGKETYGGGKYIDLKYDGIANEIELDFNLSYFPYCAYSHRYSCPIVPKENHIDMEVKAGEKYK